MSEHEKTRQLIEMAVASGKSKQSAQTGFVHYCYHPSSPNEERDTIPTIENFLFCLALLRTRTAESVLEAKELLERLLHFHDGANFPVYLHEYPNCKDRYIGTHILPIIYWILKFQQVLGNELKLKLEKCVQGLLNFALSNIKEKEPTFYILIKVAASAQAFGMSEGAKILEKIKPDDSWYTTTHLGDVLTSLQMIHSSIANSPWKQLWQTVDQTWNRRLCCYVGPARKEFQKGSEVQTHLYDLFLGCCAESYSAQALVPQVSHLHGALIQPNLDTLSSRSESNFAYSILEGKAPFDKGFHFMRMLWGDAKKRHSFVAQGGNATKVTTETVPHGIALTFHLTEPALSDDKEKNREVAFYIDDHPDLKFLVEGNASTTFQIGEKIELKDRERSFYLQFILEEGEGSYFGHIMRANRPAQTELKGKDRFNAYDWQIFLRAVRRQQPCKIKAIVTYEGTS